MNICIFGAESYIGTSFEKYMNKYTNDINVSTVDSKNENWINVDFSIYDVVLCVAGIAHVSADIKMEPLYNKINRDLPIKAALIAKKAGVAQFIFMSSMIVFGQEKPFSQEVIINSKTVPSPTDGYGKSKLEAERKILQLSDMNFKTAIIRTPMVYGPGCKGNFPRLIKLAKKTPIFPDIDNQRSMIFIDNLCSFIKKCINMSVSGIVYPQNAEYVNTKKIIELVAKHMGKKIHFTKVVNPILRILTHKVSIINRVFGSKVYDMSLSPDILSYNEIDFEKSIQLYFPKEDQ